MRKSKAKQEPQVGALLRAGGLTITKITPQIPMLPRRKKVAAYARVSVEKDVTKNSFSAQVSYFSKLIQNNPEWEYAGVYADCGETGTDRNRADFMRLLADCEDGKIDIILTKNISRFARNTVDLLQVVRRLRELGIAVIFEKENINSMNADGELMLTILASFAQEESVAISENIKWRFRKGFQNGKQKRTQVYGYRWDGENFVVEPTEAEIVRLIFTEYLAEKSPRIIAEELNAKAVKSMYGKWWGETIFSILGNEKYIGTVVMQKTFVEDPITKKKVKNNGELPRYVIENAHEAIIDKSTFEAVQERLSERKIEVRRTVFTSKIRCEVCGVNFQRATKSYKGNKTKVMACANKKQGKPCDCDGQSIPEKVLEKLTCEVLGIEEFDGDVFLAKIMQIVVPSKNVLIYHFYNRKTIIREWKSTANKDCWTPERRAAQAERMRGKEVPEETREKRRIATLRHYELHPERKIADRERMLKVISENPDWHFGDKIKAKESENE